MTRRFGRGVLRAYAALGLLLVTVSVSFGQDGLLVRSDGAWRAASFTERQLAMPGMLCVRYNNYWCIKGSSVDPWRGQVGLDGRKHAVFEHARYGARAFFVLMRTYRFRHGLRTPREIFARYAPASDCVGSLPRDPETGRCPQGENPTLIYARRVAERLGVSVDDDIELFLDRRTIDREAARAIARGVVQFELGQQRDVTDALIEEGLRLAGLKSVSTK